MEEEINKVEEPVASYGTMRLAISKSFDEAQELQYEHWRNISPEQRLEEHRIISFYFFSQKEKYTGNRLTFHQD